MEMKQIISITLLSLVATTFANPAGVAKPEECEAETPKYDEAACREACAKEPYSKEPYCETYNPNTRPTMVPGAQPGAGGVKTVVPEASPSVPSAPAAPSNPPAQQEPGATLPVGNQDVKDSDLHPEHGDDHQLSGGISIQSSLLVSALCLFFKYFFN